MSNNKFSLPVYTKLVYGDIYNNLNILNKRDSMLSVNLRSFFQYSKLVDASLRDVKLNQKLLQLGIVFGNQIETTAGCIGAYGQYDVLDVNDLQISRCQEKYEKIYPCLRFFNKDATKIEVQQKYDIVLCFMLLQELPQISKAKVINNALNAVKPGGEVVFIDYHHPYHWHPLSYLVRMYNRIHNPFVEKLWDIDIASYAKQKYDFVWRKSLYFGGMFQRLVAVRKVNPLDDGLEDISTAKSDELFTSEF